nr:MAG TPA: hypothetical protein [Siphoviridae sp. ctgbm9]DAN06928.1 MAG TPA: hypothetical protein [Bacteriophage sp.]DAP08178.1 MAG TPA: hypothetical protein [Caudoviricetes sp.]
MHPTAVGVPKENQSHWVRGLYGSDTKLFLSNSILQ